MRKHAYRVGMGLTFLPSRDIQLFERMASKGYHLSGLNVLGYYRFEKAEPETVIFTYDCSAVTEDSADFGEYEEIFAEAGWTFVYGKSGFNIFKAALGTTPIYTDTVNEAAMYRTIIKRSIPLMLVPIITALVLMVLFGIMIHTPFAIVFSTLIGGCFGVISVFVIGIALSTYRAKRIQRSQ